MTETSINCHMALLLFSLTYFLSPWTVQSFAPSSTFVRTVGRLQSAPFCQETILFSDVSESESAEEVAVSENVEEPAEEKKRFRRQRHTLFVGNLPFQTSDEELRDLFSQCGSVELVSIPVNKENNQPRGFAFVDMGSKEEVQVAIDSLAGSEFGGRTLRVTESLPKEEAKKQAKKTDIGTQKIYVGNLAFDATREEVEELFSGFGSGAKDIYFPLDRTTNAPRGFAFVTLDEEAAEQAIDETNGIDFLGRQLVVSLPLPPGEKGARRPREPRQKLYIGNLSFYTVPETLREVFEEFGEVFDCYLPEDPETGGSRGFGFVTLPKDAAEEAIRATDGCEIDGRIIRVNEAQPKGAIRHTPDDDWSDDGDDGY